MGDGIDALGITEQEEPGVFAGGDNFLIAVPDPLAEFVATEIVPDVLHRIEFRRVGRQGQQRDVVGDAQSAARLVPPGPVAHHDGMRSKPICVLISLRCSDIASALTLGMMIAAPTLRAWQMAPNRYAESWRLSRTMGGREPTGAQMYSRLPFWPTRASSWNQISIGLPAAEAGNAWGTRGGEVFKNPRAPHHSCSGGGAAVAVCSCRAGAAACRPSARAVPPTSERRSHGADRCSASGSPCRVPGPVLPAPCCVALPSAPRSARPDGRD